MDLLYSTARSTQYSVITDMGKKEYLYLYRYIDIDPIDCVPLGYTGDTFLLEGRLLEAYSNLNIFSNPT